MKTFSIAAALAVILSTILSAPAAAQHDPAATQPERALAEQAKAVAAKNRLVAETARAHAVSAANMAEDMQILATIVRENVAALYGHAAGQTSQIPAIKARSTKSQGNPPKENATKRKDQKTPVRRSKPKGNEGASGDLEMLRRIYLNLAGIVPTVKQTSRWIADPRDSNVKLAELTARLMSDDLRARELSFYNQWIQNPTKSVGLYLHGESLSSRTKNRATIDQPLVERLPGYGIVVQLKVPAPRTPVMVKPTAADDKPAASRWERTRTRLRGDRSPAVVAARNGCANCHDTSARHSGSGLKLSRAPTYVHVSRFFSHPRVSHPAPTRSQLVDALIETLAENGRHLRGLADDERVTVSLSYELPSAHSRRFQLPHWLTSKVKPAEKQPTAQATRAAAAVETDVSSNQELTGDLLMKRGEFAKAINAYRKALFGTKAKATDPLSRLPDAKRATLLPKLLTAYHAAGRHEEGMALSKQAFNKTGQGASSRYGAALGRGTKWDIITFKFVDRPRGPKLPGRISVSATKAQLNLLADGTLSERNFASQVQVRIFDPMAAKNAAKIQPKKSSQSAGPRRTTESKASR